MSNWVPAREVAELMEAPPDSRADTVARKRSGTPGARARPSPSVPPTDPDPANRPANMVDIASLRARQGRPPVNTLMGVGEKDKEAIRESIRSPVRIPGAPKMPAIDGGWREGAARHDDDEETVTRVRPDDDRTLAEGNKRPTQPYTDTKSTKPRETAKDAKPRLQGGGARSVPPPLRRRSKDGKGAAVTASKPPPGPRRPRPKAVPTLVSSHDKGKGKPSDNPSAKPPVRPSRRPPPATPSSAVLSESFDRASRKGTSPTGAIPVDGEQAASQAIPETAPLPNQGPAAAAADVGEPRPHLPTGPLPEAEELQLPLGRPPAAQPQAGPEEPAQGRQPWDPPEAAVAEDGGQVDLGMAALAAATRPMPPSTPRRLAAIVSPTVLMAAGGVALVLIAVAFLFGRMSAPARSGLADVATARAGLAAVPLFTRSKTVNAAPRPCLMLRAPSLLADGASRSIPIEFGSFEGRLAVGYGRSIHQARGMLVNLGNGEVETVYKPDELEGSVSRVVPLVSGSDLSFGVTMTEQESVDNGVYVPASTPFVVGFGKGTVVKVSGPGSEPAELWPLEASKKADALRVAASAKGTMITYRAGDEVHYGMLGPDGEVTQVAQPVMSFELPEGKRAIVGKPVVASNGQDVSVVFAYKAAEPGATVEMRWARGPIGKPLADAALVDIPAGGPGGDAIAPAITAIGGGRWLLMWTEGKTPGPYTLRAQTYDRRYRPIGEALRVSPATGSFGQGTVGAVGDDVAVLFLLATRTSYEVWGTVLQCR